MSNDSSLFNEEDADAIVKAVELLHGKKVIIINEGNTPMQVVLYKDQDGQIKRAVNFEEVTREQLVELANEHKAQVQIYEEAIALYDELTKSEGQEPVADQPEPTPEAPTEPTPQPETPQEEQPQPTAEPEPTPVETPQPAPEAEAPQPEQEQPAPVIA